MLKFRSGFFSLSLAGCLAGCFPGCLASSIVRINSLAIYLAMALIVTGIRNAAVASAGTEYPGAPKAPKLSLVLVIDQLRSDQLSRFQSRFLPESEKGLLFLMRQGAYFPSADFGLFQNMTCPGHAVILTGSYPYQNGIIANVWWDRKTQKRVYCVEDPESPLVSPEPATPAEASAEASAKSGIASKHGGLSPRNLVGTTLGDEIKNSGLGGKVLSFSVKDRGAILLGGHRADLAVWFHEETSQWVTSRFYTQKFPEFLKQPNEQLSQLRAQASPWKPLGSFSAFSEALPQLPSKYQRPGLNSSQTLDGKNLVLHPAMVEQLVGVAMAGVRAYQLGKKGPDILTVSISTHDHVGHEYSANSHEWEDVFVHEDRQISRLLKFLDKQVGLQNLQIVLTSDHGIPHYPEKLQAERVPSGRIDEKKWEAQLNEHLNQVFKIKGKLVAALASFQVGVDENEVRKHSLSSSEVFQEIKKWLLDQEPVQMVATRNEMLSNLWPQGIWGDQLQRNFYPRRSSDIYFMPKPYWINSEKLVNHLTGYSYDRLVPLIFWGKAFKRGVYRNTVRMVDVAPTLSSVFGINPPPLAEGRVLTEALR